MKIIFFGTPDFVIPLLAAVIKQHNVVAVVTAPDQKAGRKQLLTPSPVKVFAEKHDISVLQPENFHTKAHLSFPKSDLFIVAAYGKIIPRKLLDLPSSGAINVHPSLLPRYRGPTPIQSAILQGDTTTGVSFMKMDAQMDHGPILAMHPYKIKNVDTFDNLVVDMFAIAAKLLPDIIMRYASGEIKPQAQDDSKATFAKIISKQDGYIDMDNPPEPTTLDRMIRAYYPWPTVWTRITTKNREARIKLLPGNKIQMEGKKPVSLKNFLNGYPELKDQLKRVLQGTTTDP